MIVVWILLGALIASVVFAYFKFNKQIPNFIDSWLIKGMKSGIKEIKYSDHRISIYFNNEVSLLDAWNANKLYSWIGDGKICYKDETIAFYHEDPSMKTKKRLNNLVKEFEYNKYINRTK